MHSKKHCRLSNISQTGKWIETERFKFGDKVIVRHKGASVGKLMLGWRKLRKEHPEMFQNIFIYQQPSAFVDSLIQKWMLQDLQSEFPGSVWQRDCFQAAFTQESREGMFLTQSIPAR